MKRFIMLLVSCLAIGCSFDSQGPQQAEYWKSEVSYLNSVNPSLSTAWERYKKYEVKKDSKTGNVIVTDKGTTDSVVCSSWHFIVTIVGDRQGKVKAASLDQVGTCL